MDKSETKNKDRGAFACIDTEYLQEGLTKREYFASKALQGMCAGIAKPENPIVIAKDAVDLADALLEALEKKEEFDFHLKIDEEEYSIEPPKKFENHKENPLAEKIKLIQSSQYNPKGNKVIEELYEDYKDFKGLKEESKLDGVWLDESTKITKEQIDKLKQSQINKIEVVDVEEVSSGNYTMTLSSPLNIGDEVKVGMDKNGVPKTINVKKPKKEKEYSQDVHNCYVSCLTFFSNDLLPDYKEANNWLDAVDKLNRLDGLSFDDIIVLTKAARSDKFWRKNFLSLVKLRRKDKDKIPYWKVFKEKFSVNETKSKKIVSAYEQAMKNLG